MGRPGGKRPLGRRRRRWEEDIKLDLNKPDGKEWPGLIWLMIGKGGGLL